MTFIPYAICAANALICMGMTALMVRRRELEHARTWVVLIHVWGAAFVVVTAIGSLK